MRSVRVFYQKIDRAKYLSHLDLMRSMMRSLKMSKLDVKYTQGFNPRIYLTFALPLSLGYEGLRESMDFDLLDERVTHQEIKDKLIRVMPESIPIIEVDKVYKDAKEISFADYEISYNSGNLLTHENMWQKFLDKETMEVEKKSKKKSRIIDIKKDMKNIVINQKDEDIVISVRLPAGINYNVNPRLVIKAFEKETGEKTQPSFKRISILDGNMDLFK